MAVSAVHHRAVNGSFVSKLSSSRWNACSSGIVKMKRHQKTTRGGLHFSSLTSVIKLLLKLAVITISMFLCQESSLQVHIATGVAPGGASIDVLLRDTMVND